MRPRIQIVICIIRIGQRSQSTSGAFSKRPSPLPAASCASTSSFTQRHRHGDGGSASEQRPVAETLNTKRGFFRTIYRHELPSWHESKVSRVTPSRMGWGRTLFLSARRRKRQVAASRFANPPNAAPSVEPGEVKCRQFLHEVSITVLAQMCKHFDTMIAIARCRAF